MSSPSPHADSTQPNLLDDPELAPFDAAAIERTSALMEKYEALPMDFADATLIVLADILGTTSVFTLGRRDFGIYRLGRRKLTLVPQPRK